MNRRAVAALVSTAGMTLVAVGSIGIAEQGSNSASRPAAIHAAASGGAPPTAVAQTDGQNIEGVNQIDKLPDCIPVSNRSGATAGCVMKADEFAPPPVFDAMSTSGGLPVYDVNDHTRVVGTLDGGIGFVPAALADQKPELRTCTDSLVAELKGAANASSLSQQCRDLLSSQGYPASTLDGR